MGKTIEQLNWWEYEKLQRGGPYMTAADHVMIFKRESIPIVFVPGIMGSRLRRGDDSVWDPDSTWTMAKNFLFASPADREKLLNDDGLGADTRPDKKDDSTPDQRWCGVAWGFYGKIIKYLAAHGSMDPKTFPPSKYFVLPVYAFPYDWVGDNGKSGADLSTRIHDIITLEQKKGLICEKAIVVSHSMGGMVSRAALKLAGAEGVTFGAIHGAQPATGAPAAYRRMRAGFENPGDTQSKVLGNSAESVVPVLGNSVGGLELLPTQFYKTNDAQADWLSVAPPSSVPIVGPKGDPYDKIYSNKDDFLRLIYDPAQLDPAKIHSGPSSTLDPVRVSRVTYIAKLRDAQNFHKALQLQCHGTTYSSWVGHADRGTSGLKTWDKIEFRFKGERQPIQHKTAAYFYKYDEDPNPKTGQGFDYWDCSAKPSDSGFYEIQPQSGSGDGTVPASSGGALSSQSVRTKTIDGGVEHSAFYGNSDIQTWTVACIGEMVKKHFSSRVPSPKK